MGEPDTIDWLDASLPGPAFAEALHALRERGPVVPVPVLGGSITAYYIAGYDALADAFKDGERFPPSAAYQRISEPFIGQTFMSMDEEPHRIYRPPLTTAFRRTAVEALDEAELAALAHELIDRFVARRKVELTGAYTRLFSFGVICRLLGLPRERERDYYACSMDLMFGGRDREAWRRADAMLSGMVRAVLAERRREPREDVISDWLRLRVEDRPLSEESILAHVRLVFTAGATTTSDALGNLVHTLLRDRDAWRAVADEPALAADAALELLRYEPPVATQPRVSRADADVIFRGVEIPRNSLVLFGIAAANRDPATFPDPDRYDLSRRPEGLLTFGPGLRTCPGMYLARKNLRIALQVLVERLPELRLFDAPRSQPEGVLLRGPKQLPVAWP